MVQAAGTFVVKVTIALHPVLEGTWQRYERVSAPLLEEAVKGGHLAVQVLILRKHAGHEEPLGTRLRLVPPFRHRRAVLFPMNFFQRLAKELLVGRLVQVGQGASVKGASMASAHHACRFPQPIVQFFFETSTMHPSNSKTHLSPIKFLCDISFIFSLTFCFYEI